MSPTMEEPPARIFVVHLIDGTKAEVSATTICKPNDESDAYRLKREGQIVAEFPKEDVRSWWIKTESKPKPMSARVVG